MTSAPPTPRAHHEPPMARLIAMAAFAFFFASAVHLAVRGVSVHELQLAFPLYALGGFSGLIFGTSRLLIAGMAGRDMAGGRPGALLTAIPAALGAVGLYFSQESSASLAAASASLWAMGAMSHVVITLVTVRRPAVRPPIRDPTATPGSRAPARVLDAASLAYTTFAAALLPLAYLGHVTRAGAVHAVLVGFVITTIMSVATRILPRFTRARIPTSLLVALTPFALVGPALMTFGLDRWRVLLPYGAVTEGVALLLFALAVAWTLLRADRFRLPNASYGAALLAIGVGGLLALDYATTGRQPSQLATHGLLNVFGFVGMFVIAASSDMYAPALAAGAAPAERHALLASLGTSIGLLLAALGTGFDAPLVARVGMALYALALLWHLVGLVASHKRAGRVIARLRGSAGLR